jgi:hypothetical protein
MDSIVKNLALKTGVFFHHHNPVDFGTLEL